MVLDLCWTLAKRWWGIDLEMLGMLARIELLVVAWRRSLLCIKGTETGSL